MEGKMDRQDMLNTPIVKQFLKGYAQIELARFSTAREAVFWAFQGADNMVAALLDCKTVGFNKKSHKDKWQKFMSAHPVFQQRVSADRIEQCRKLWEEARYRDNPISADDAGQVLEVAHQVFKYGLEVLAPFSGVSIEDLKKAVYDAAKTELAMVESKAIDDYLKAREANTEQDASRLGLHQYALMLGDPATYTHYSLHSDQPGVQELIQANTEVAKDIAEGYAAFIRAVTKIALNRVSEETWRLATSKDKVSGEQASEFLKRLADAFDFNLLLRFSFIGYNFIENVEQVREVIKSLEEGRIELTNPRLVQESSPRIVQYNVRIQKE